MTPFYFFRWNLVYLTFILHGIGTLMPWNMFITAKDVRIVLYVGLTILYDLLIVLYFVNRILVLRRLQTWPGVYRTDRKAYLRSQLFTISWFCFSSAKRYIQLVKHLYANWVRHQYFLFVFRSMCGLKAWQKK